MIDRAIRSGAVIWPRNSQSNFVSTARPPATPGRGNSGAITTRWSALIGPDSPVRHARARPCHRPDTSAQLEGGASSAGRAPLVLGVPAAGSQRFAGPRLGCGVPGQGDHGASEQKRFFLSPFHCGFRFSAKRVDLK